MSSPGESSTEEEPYSDDDSFQWDEDLDEIFDPSKDPLETIAEMVVQIQEKQENKKLMKGLHESPMIRALQEMEPELLDEEELILIQETTKQQGKEKNPKRKRRKRKPKQIQDGKTQKSRKSKANKQKTPKTDRKKTENEKRPEDLKKHNELRQQLRRKIQELTQQTRKETLLLWMKSKIKRRHKNKQKHETTTKSTKKKKKAANTLETKLPTKSNDHSRGLGGLDQLK